MWINEALAQGAGPGAGGSDALLTFMPIILIVVIMYFLIIRPQQRRMKQTQEMIANIRRGDTVVTVGGIIGKVAKVDESEIQVDIADNVRVRMSRQSVAEVRSKSEPVKEG